jgi:alpha-galactosidase
MPFVPDTCCGSLAAELPRIERRAKMTNVNSRMTVILLTGLWVAAATSLQASDPPAGSQDCATSLAPALPWNEGKPVINGPEVYGASPGKEFLYLIPTIGGRPIKFSAENLPAGLSVDAEKGLIRGKAEKRGQYQVVVTAENSQGKCSKSLKLRIEDHAIALTPPMGWNSWNCYRSTIDDVKIRATADGMVRSGLAARGYAYVNLDSGWQSKQRGGKLHSIVPRDGFPNMKALCDHIHSLGLKAGLYSSPYVVPWGTDGCGTSSGPCDTSFPWFLAPNLKSKYIGLDKHEREDVAQWAEWGFDYFKYDWAQTDMILTERMSRQLRASSRDIVFSITTDVQINDAVKVKELANLWRSNRDTGPQWQSVVQNGFNNEQWNPVIGPGHWFDLDMTALMPLDGKSLTHNERIACVSRWMMRPSPILIDCDLTRPLDDFTLRLLCNEEIIAVNQDSLGKPSASILKKDGWDIQLKPLVDGSYALAVFNLGDKPAQSPKVDLGFFGLDGKLKVRDLWNKKDLGEFNNGFAVGVDAHCAKVFKISKP